METEVKDKETETPELEATETPQVDEKDLIEASNEFDKLISGEADDNSGDADDTTVDDKNSDGKPDADDKNTGDDKGKEEAAEKTEEQTEEKPAVIDDALLTRAVRAGLDLSEAKTFGSAAALSKTLDLLESRSGKETATTTDTATGEAKPFEVKPFEVKFENEEELDPEIVKTVKGVNEHYAAQIGELNKHVAGTVKALQDEIASLKTQLGGISESAEVERFDNAINTLGDEYAELFGSGSGHDLDQKSAQFKNRVTLFNELATISKGIAASGKPMPQFKTIFQKAVASAFGSETTKLSVKKAVSATEKRNSQVTHRPSHRLGKPVSTEEKLIEQSNDFDKKIGL
jgi:hypothetical protein